MSELPPPVQSNLPPPTSRHRRVPSPTSRHRRVVGPMPVRQRSWFMRHWHARRGWQQALIIVALVMGVLAISSLGHKKTPTTPTNPAPSSAGAYCAVLNSESQRIGSKAFIELVVPTLMKGYSPEKQAAMRADVAAHCPQWTFAVNP